MVHPSLSDLVETLEYSHRMMDLQKLSKILIKDSIQPVCANNIVNSSKLHQEKYEPLVKVENFADLKVLSGDKVMESIFMSANNSNYSYQAALDLLKDFQKSFSILKDAIYIAEALSCGRPVKELELNETKKIITLLNKEITFYQMHLTSKENKDFGSVQVVTEHMDLFGVMQAICSGLRHGKVVVTTSCNEKRVLSDFVLSASFNLLGSNNGNVSFIPVKVLSIVNESKFLILSDLSELHKGWTGSCGIKIFSYSRHSCAIICESADIDAACKSIVDSVTYNSGCSNSAPHVTLVQESILEKVEFQFSKMVETYTCCNPLDAASNLGPIASKLIYDDLSEKMSLLSDDGGKVSQMECSANFTDCAFNLSVISGIQTGTAFMQDLPRGPYTCLVSFRTLKEAIAIANRIITSKEKALIFSECMSQVHEAIKLLNYPQLGVNCSSLDIAENDSNCLFNVYISPYCKLNTKSVNDSFDSKSLSSIVKLSRSAALVWCNKIFDERHQHMKTQFVSSFKQYPALVDLIATSEIDSSCASLESSRYVVSLNQSYGVVLLVLDSEADLVASLFLIYAILALGNTVIVTSSSTTLRNHLDNLNANFIKTGVEKNVLLVLENDVQSFIMGLCKNIPLVDLILCFTDSYPHLKIPFCEPVFFFDRVKSIHLYANKIKRCKSVTYFSGDIFAN